MKLPGSISDKPNPLPKLTAERMAVALATTERGTIQEAAALWDEISKRECVANSAVLADVRETAIANALDPTEAIDFSEDADGWFKISPYGTFRGKTPGRPQIVSKDSAQAMEGEFNSALGKLGRKFRGVPIYHGHPDVDPEIWTDDRRIGKVTKLEARADGLWGYAEWNSIGEDNKREGWWIYPSPRWDAPPGQTQFSPDRLISIGLTNTPRIAESDPVFNSQLETKNNTTMDPKIIREKLGLAPEATDEEVLAKLEKVTAAATAGEAANAQLATVEKEKEGMENSITGKDREITSLREAHNNSLLDAAEKDARIKPSERPAWAARLNGANRAEEINSLQGLTPQLNTGKLDLSGRRDERKQSDNLREEVSNAVEALKKDKGLSHAEAWKKVKRDAKFKGFFDRSEG
jgi:predicted  nucleic acid-binding Zn-ribbon protein